MTIEPGVCYRDGWGDIDYVEAISDLRNAYFQRRSMRRGEPQTGCMVCGDSGHTVETCHHDPLQLARKWTAASAVFTCFHCGVVCTTTEEAVAHFGRSEDEITKCLRERLDSRMKQK
jgi:hypothetical protein